MGFHPAFQHPHREGLALPADGEGGADVPQGGGAGLDREGPRIGGDDEAGLAPLQEQAALVLGILDAQDGVSVEVEPAAVRQQFAAPFAHCRLQAFLAVHGRQTEQGAATGEAGETGCQGLAPAAAAGLEAVELTPQFLEAGVFLGMAGVGGQPGLEAALLGSGAFRPLQAQQPARRLLQHRRQGLVFRGRAAGGHGQCRHRRSCTRARIRCFSMALTLMPYSRARSAWRQPSNL